MPFLYALEYLVTIFGAIFVITQVLVPTLRNRPLFPLFRDKPRELREKLTEAQEAAEIADLEAQIAKATIEVNQRRRRVQQAQAEAKLADAEAEEQTFQTEMDVAATRVGKKRNK